MAKKIKFPTLITSPLDTHYQRVEQMVTDVTNLIDNYNNRAPGDKLRIPYRGKLKSKVIKAVNTSVYNIGQKRVVQLCIEEYKEGYNDLYFQHGQDPQVELDLNDKLGSSQNYALLYPFIDNVQPAVNKWLVIIYDTPNKDDADIVHTVKYVINKILNFPFNYVIPEQLDGRQVIPKVEVTYATVENIRNDELRVRNHVVSAQSRNTRKIVYENLPSTDADMLLNNDDVAGNIKKAVRFFYDMANPSSYTKYEFEADDDGAIMSVMTTKYSRSYDLTEGDEVRLLNADFMRVRFIEVINDYILNGEQQ